ncbi:class I SAM-dependent methyltransferase [Georgenia thermotolerans]|uniref:Methyltransferase domain-containing protein n=1 Tax=Georgenia thermotolerans TaxID=527326 RepID=A0A7J5UM14_9MICO|nr:class I SAM-dependent methyltransferase [Georgenia thermotolerans]KAE8763330.1 methyltransferase domain-containing protein [Georgenia thermotolerans]
MMGYSLAYRLGFTPWEHHGKVTRAHVEALLEREEAGRSRPPGRALDLGCGRGQYTPRLTRRGWEVVGIDVVPQAVEAARRRRLAHATFVVGDVTNLVPGELGTFDFFLDVGCFQGLNAEQRRAEGRGVSALANPGATLLMLAFGATPIRSVVGGVSRAEVEAAFEGWEMLSVDPADTTGLGWPLTRTSPRWYRLRLAA